MSQTPQPVAPPPYSEEYDKPPSYFSQHHQGNAPTVHAQPPYPTQPPGAYPPQGPSMYPPPPPQGGPQPQRTVIAVTTAPAYVATGQQQILVLGDCPRCRIGFIRNDFDLCGIVLAIVFFPIGVLCCLCMMDRRCSHCGYRA